MWKTSWIICARNVQIRQFSPPESAQYLPIIIVALSIFCQTSNGTRRGRAAGLPRRPQGPGGHRSRRGSAVVAADRSASGTTSTPSGARRSLPGRPFAGRGVAGRKAGCSRVGPARAGRRNLRPQGVRGPAVRPATGADPDDPFRRAGRLRRKPGRSGRARSTHGTSGLSRVRDGWPQG